jgi:hypothetical protein
MSFFALAYLITWPLHMLSIVLADRARTSVSNEDNFNLFADLVFGEVASDRLWAIVVYNLGQFGPVLSAFIVTAIIYGSTGVRDLAARVVKWRIAPRWYLLAGVLPLLLMAVSLTAALLAGGFKLGPFSPKVAWAAFIAFFLYMVVFNGLAEEPGWRGFALPHLQASRTATRSSWLLGTLWGVWHIPFMVYYFRDQPALLIASLFGLVIGIVGWTLVLTWLYNNTESVLLMILLHGWYNVVQSYLIMGQPHPLAWTLYSVVPWAFAAYLSKRYGDEHLGHAPRPRWWPGLYSTEQRGDAGPTTLPAQTALSRIKPESQ